MNIFKGLFDEYGIFKLTWDAEKALNYSKNGMRVILFGDNSIRLLPEDRIYSVNREQVEYFEHLGEDSCVEISTDGRILTTYSISGDNTLYITDKCNSNCIMCPMGEYVRKNGKSINTDVLKQMIRYMPQGMEHLTITGGEPFFIREAIFELLNELKINDKAQSYLLLTNGRIFSIRDYVERFKTVVPDNTLVGIPIHGSCGNAHDSISQSKGSFEQTIMGIKNIISIGKVRVEIRIVVNRMNLKDLIDISELIIRELKGISCVRFMGMEMLGNAVINADKVWVPYAEAFTGMKEAINRLVLSGVDVSIYNFPLCFVEEAYWGMCENSISTHKIRYAEKCSECREQKACGGMFWGTDKYLKDTVRPIE